MTMVFIATKFDANQQSSQWHVVAKPIYTFLFFSRILFIFRPLPPLRRPYQPNRLPHFMNGVGDNNNK